MPNQHITELPEARVSSILLAPFVLGGIVLSVLSGAFLAIHYVGYPNAPTPIVPYILLPVGLLLAAIGQRLTTGRWEGITEVLHIRLAYAGLLYTGMAMKYAVGGRPIHRYPVGLLIISVILMISRLLAKRHAKLRSTVRIRR